MVIHQFSTAVSRGLSLARFAQFHIQRLLFSLILGTAALLFVLYTPARAAQVQIQPISPQLGDTISVVVQTSSTQDVAPTVTSGQRTYPTFAIAPNRYRAFVPTTPLDPPGNLNIQVSGEPPQTFTLSLRNRDFPTQSIWLSGDSASLGTDYEFDRVDAFKRLVTPEKYWNGAFQRPNQGEITTIYGVRRYYNGEFAQDYFHRGVDYAGPTGDPIVAPAAGRIALIGRVEDGFELHGNTIGIDHGQGVLSIMLHLSRIDVKEGDFVQPGQRIGAVGATGAVTGAHLHWGLYVHGQCVDPVPWRNSGFE
ncbi:M23 family metallopeptidase [Thermocoleostomius sinensis]|uniref:M23 family metallopeptidase n=1 Tax=Thermocoleostomius sinensis A174 TaxID=2016057 RepID=A0A9E8ZIE1_9CYAN|nr:M23 family metallopeptidase [Thermocoleostomius sinensis]WAL61770.1 M23 family metallopeptidase [Thermocoleostomius sinensis A174]